ncbi:hypothetical protein L1049_024451 [Liquidambar formosana]|uniref:Protein SCAI n=1 Tax=Liquidambar formosana TaxID=63359 RepID=A0AAP0RUY3_LIQFO
MADDVVPRTFRALVESADRKFARVRDVPAYGRGPNVHYFHKVFKAYMRLWKYQQENRSKLVASGLQRWEIGEIASRIGQLYFGQYMRTSEARFLLESYIFYEAILNRGYFQGSKGSVKDLGVRFKELRFYARFLLVSLILCRFEMVRVLVERFRALVDDCKASFRETNFKEWKLVVQEIVRLMKVETAYMNVRPLRYSTSFDSHPSSLPYVARFHAKRILKFQDAVLTSYHRNEVKFAELTLDTFRMVQCLEWEPSGSFFQKRPIESNENGVLNDYSGTSGLIDINLAMDITDPTLPPNPRKAILYRPSVTHLIAVIATICEELPPDSIMLIYLSASGKAGRSNVSQMESSGSSRKSSKRVVPRSSHEQNSYLPEVHVNDKGNSSDWNDTYLWLGPRGNGGSNNLYPGDIIPFTRKPLFLIIDSDTSHAFKAGLSKLVLHGAERGETTALLLSPLRPAFESSSGVDKQNGSQFTFFLTAPLQAFSQLVGLSYSNTDTDVYNDAENIISAAFSEWELILCTSTSLDLVWAQVLSDPFLRRIILRFIFCRSVLSLFCPPEDSDEYLPVCLPHLPSSVSPNSEAVQSTVIRLANHLRVADCFHFNNT